MLVGHGISQGRVLATGYPYLRWKFPTHSFRCVSALPGKVATVRFLGSPDISNGNLQVKHSAEPLSAIVERHDRVPRLSEKEPAFDQKSREQAESAQAQRQGRNTTR